MAKQHNVKIVEKNEGTKIPFEQDDSRLFFGDEDIMINAAKYQRDWPVHVDICADDNNNLVIGAGAGRYYVAQVDIPATVYTEVEPGDHDEGGMDPGPQPEPIPLDMADVVVTLWSIDDLPMINR